MVTKPTVVVLGAGASQPLGFPLGTQLRQVIVGTLADPNSVQFLKLLELGCDSADIRDFRDALLYSGKPSVDAFLEHRTDFMGIGKAAIAQALIPYEAVDRLFEDAGSLYAHIYARLNAPLERFADNQLAVITYNYDRSFEHYLFTALKHSYRLDDHKTGALAGAIPIVHLHGHMGDLPWQAVGGRAYEPIVGAEEIGKASARIKIIHEDVQSDPEFARARGLLTEGRRLIFLGFGYDETNLSRLGLELGRQDTYGSCLGFSFVEREQLEVRFNKTIHLANPGLDALRCLREHEQPGRWVTE